jgi:hypothetical protein
MAGRRIGWTLTRAAIREYQRATSDPAGTLELMLAQVETGTKFTCEYVDIDEAFYDSLCSTLHDVKKLLISEEGRPLYGQVRDRLKELARLADGIGWGYGDYVGDVVGELEQTLGDPARSETS